MAKLRGLGALIVLLVAGAIPVADAKEPPNYDGWTELHRAAADGDVAKTSALLARGATVDARNGFDRTPLYEAAKRGQVATVEILLARGAKVGVREHIGFTPLHIAAEQKHPEVLKVLIARGADVNAKNDRGQTPLWQASWQSWHEDASVARILADAGAKLDSFDEGGWAPIHMAARSDFAEMIVFLKQRGVDPDLSLRDHPSWGPLHVAADAGRVEAIAALLDAGAEIDLHGPEVGATPLLAALREKQYPAAALLLRRGADVNARPIAVMPPLAVAVEQGQQELVALLLQRGADVNARTKGWSAFQLAEARKDSQAMATLRAAGAKEFGE